MRNKILFLSATIILILNGCSTKTESNPEKVYTTYCIDREIVYPNWTKTETKTSQKQKESDYSQRQALLAKPTEELLELLNKDNSIEINGNALYVIGQSYLQNKNYDKSIPFFKCAAENFFDTKAMLKMAKIYFIGDKEAKLSIDMPIDYNKAYFWILNAIYIDISQGEKNNIMANGLGLMDELQNVDEYVQKGLAKDKVEQESSAFIEKLFPEQENLEDTFKSHYQYILN